ncbi:uncharacterized protein LOC116774742 [Danaus plexippus]|uniref:Uncharacterized protein n=1 Tax=Danaus plexippus plexippus TaxID=278856 RepID=A0A212EJ68_DANPL|nr:uncharacterized protein LOC116774742 [Danaus plexippus]OWR41521.1 hypothetical protein KGM_200558 [Danaus plexippus plexippus]
MASVSTPVNTINRENLMLLIRNNVLNTSLEFNDPDVMETESPVRKPSNLRPVIKKLFHSPITSQASQENAEMRSLSSKERRRKRKRRELLIGSEDNIRMAYMSEAEGGSPEACGAMRKRVLISLFHNKEYCMETGE